MGHGLTKHRLFATWNAMINRCHNPKNAAYSYYGGRGVGVCERWRDPAAFISDMAPTHKDGLTLDRLDNNGPYSPENCSWVSRAEQSYNRRSNVYLEHDGKRQAISKWAADLGVSPRTLWARIDRGWSHSDAITVPFGPTIKRASLVTYRGVTDTIYNHARRAGLNPVQVAQRVQRSGWSVEQALETPIKSPKITL